MTNKDGTVTSRKDFTDEQKASVAKLDSAYTRTVNALAKNATASAQIKGPDGKFTEVKAGKLASALKKQNFTVDASKFDYMRSSPGQTTVHSQGLNPPTGLYGVRGASSERMYEIAITHEGIHAGYPWADNMWAGGSEKGFERHHQEPFNHVAEGLLQ